MPSSIPPAGFPLLESELTDPITGQISRPWYQFFRALWFRTGGASGGAGLPGGPSGSIQYNDSDSFGGFVAHGDAAIDTSTGLVTVSSIDGIPPGTAAFENLSEVIIDNGTGGLTIAPGAVNVVMTSSPGIVADVISINDAVMVLGSTTLISASGEFTPSDAANNKRVVVKGAGTVGANSNLETNIAVYVSPTEVELAAAATAGVTNAVCYWGTNNDAAIQTAIDTGSLRLPRGRIGTLLGINATATSSLIMEGQGNIGSVIEPLATNPHALLDMVGSQFATIRDLQLGDPANPCIGLVGILWGQIQGQSSASRPYFQSVFCSAPYSAATGYWLGAVQGVAINCQFWNQLGGGGFCHVFTYDNVDGVTSAFQTITTSTSFGAGGLDQYSCENHDQTFVTVDGCIRFRGAEFNSINSSFSSESVNGVITWDGTDSAASNLYAPLIYSETGTNPLYAFQPITNVFNLTMIQPNITATDAHVNPAAGGTIGAGSIFGTITASP